MQLQLPLCGTASVENDVFEQNSDDSVAPQLSSSTS